jgi:hypothetical protein
MTRFSSSCIWIWLTVLYFREVHILSGTLYRHAHIGRQSRSLGLGKRDDTTQLLANMVIVLCSTIGVCLVCCCLALAFCFVHVLYGTIICLLLCHPHQMWSMIYDRDEFVTQVYVSPQEPWKELVVGGLWTPLPCIALVYCDDSLIRTTTSRYSFELEMFPLGNLSIFVISLIHWI